MRVGTVVSNASSPSLLVLSFALAVVGAWVSLILGTLVLLFEIDRNGVFCSGAGHRQPHSAAASVRGWLAAAVRVRPRHRSVSCTLLL